MIIEKLLNEKELTEAEKCIAKYVLQKENNIENITSTELGKRSFTSQSSVIRLYKKLGIKTYREFLSILLLERNEYFKVTDISNEELFPLFASYEDAQNTLASIYQQTIVNTNLVLNKNALIRLCNRLMTASAVDVYGTGISNTMAKQLTYKLLSLGLPCSFQPDINEAYLDSKTDTKSNISILLSLTQNNKSIINIAKELNRRGLSVFSISDKSEEKLSKNCNDQLYFNNSKYTGRVEYDDVYVMCSLFAAGYIIDLIYSILLYRKKSTYFTNIQSK